MASLLVLLLPALMEASTPPVPELFLVTPFVTTKAKPLSPRASEAASVRFDLARGKAEAREKYLAELRAALAKGPLDAHDERFHHFRDRLPRCVQHGGHCEWMRKVATGDPSSAVRSWFWQALGSCGDRQTQSLIEAGKAPPNAAMSWIVERPFGRLEWSPALEDLLVKAASASSSLAPAAARALRNVDPERAVAAILKAHANAAGDVRTNLGIALVGSSTDPRVMKIVAEVCRANPNRYECRHLGRPNIRETPSSKLPSLVESTIELGAFLAAAPERAGEVADAAAARFKKDRSYWALYALSALDHARARALIGELEPTPAERRLFAHLRAFPSRAALYEKLRELDLLHEHELPAAVESPLTLTRRTVFVSEILRAHGRLRSTRDDVDGVTPTLQSDLTALAELVAPALDGFDFEVTPPESARKGGVEGFVVNAYKGEVRHSITVPWTDRKYPRRAVIGFANALLALEKSPQRLFVLDGDGQRLTVAAGPEASWRWLLEQGWIESPWIPPN